MIETHSDEYRRKIEALLGSPNPAEFTTFEILIDGEFFTDRVREIEYGSEDGPAIVLDADLFGKLPLSREGTVVECRILIDGNPVTTFLGRALRPEARGFNTNLIAATPGYWLDKVILGETVEFINEKPDLAIYRVIYKAPYEHGLVEVEKLDGPRFNKSGGEGFLSITKISDVLESLKEEVPFYSQDRPNGGFLARKPPVLGRAEEIVWSFDVDESIVREDFEYSRTDESYYDVLVYRETGGEIEELYREPIPGSRAPVGVTLPVQISDTSEDAPENARQAAYDAVTKHQYGEYEGSFKTQYINPLLERGDVVTVREIEYSREATIERLWYFLIEGYKHFPLEKEAQYSGKMAIVSEVVLQESDTPPSTTSASVVAHG